MEIIDRKTAKLKNRNKYFTGEPCKNGHYAQRYVQSGACEQCLGAYRSSNEQHEANSRKKEVIGYFTSCKLMCPHTHADEIFQIALALSQVRDPNISSVDIRRSVTTKMDWNTGTLGRYHLYLHPGDHQTMRDISNTYTKACNPVNIEADRQARLKQVLEMVEKERSEQLEARFKGF